MSRPSKTKKAPPPRRKKGTGSVIQKGGKWYGRLRVYGVETLTEGFDTEEKAGAALDAKLNGHIDPRTLPTLEGLWESVIAEGGDWDQDERYDYQTLNLYDSMLNNHIRGTALGKMRIDQIRRSDVQRLINRKYKERAKSTVRRIGSCISVVFGHAIEKKMLRDRMEDGDFVPANPCAGVKYEAIPKTEAYVFSDPELEDYASLLYEFHPRLSAMITILADTGARPGELGAMNSEDIIDGHWTIRRMLRRDKELIDGTKNEVVRTIALSPDALAAIQEQGQRRGYSFVTRTGKPITSDYLWTHINRFKKWLARREEAKAMEEGRDPRPIPPLNARNLRKTFVTRGVEKGDVKSVQAAVGHKHASTTLDVYAQSRKDPQKKLVEQLSGDLNRRVFKDKGRDKGPN